MLFFENRWQSGGFLFAKWDFASAIGRAFAISALLADRWRGDEYATGRTGYLRGLLQPIAGEPLLREDLSFDVERDDLRGRLGLLNRTAGVDVTGPLAIERHVRPPVVVPIPKSGAGPVEVVEALDERHRPRTGACNEG